MPAMASRLPMPTKKEDGAGGEVHRGSLCAGGYAGRAYLPLPLEVACL